MTKKQFKEALLRGQGRCIKAVQSNPERYYDIVLWACSHEVAFDPQCEGSRAWFVYQLISSYTDSEPFIEILIESMKNAKSNGGWKILYLVELLKYFADDGSDKARQALWDKYEQLYDVLLLKRTLPSGLFHARDDFAMICEVLADNKTAVIRIAEDVGRLYREKAGLYEGEDFAWLFESKIKRYARSLEKLEYKSANIAEFLYAGRMLDEMWEQEPQPRNEKRTGRRLSVWLKNRIDKEAIWEYANTYLRQEDPIERAKALGAFCACPFPGDPFPIIQDAKSDTLQLREAAWRALENIRHPIVREFALEQLQEDLETALPVLVVNYEAQDEKMLVDYVKSVKIDFKCTTSWHSMHLDILGMKNHGLKAPASLLQLIFENTYCSCCREYALRQMGKRRLVTKEILEECLYDSNVEIRVYAKRRLK